MDMLFLTFMLRETRGTKHGAVGMGCCSSWISGMFIHLVELKFGRNGLIYFEFGFGGDQW